MSLRITRPGVLDTIQDGGRRGYQHLGINPDGPMDRFSAALANALLGKELSAPVIEFHYPASRILFEKDALFALTGGNFSPEINGLPVPMDHPVAVKKGSVLSFGHLQSGARCYASFLGAFLLQPWMGSYSTNTKMGRGGAGKPFEKDDVIYFADEQDLSFFLKDTNVFILPWKAQDTVDTRKELECVIGSEWNWLRTESREAFTDHWFQVNSASDRMGYRLTGPQLETGGEQLVSSGVNFGTVQLLPSGQLIILMADHQTTGGYPRIAHIISAHLPILAQKGPNDVIRFRITQLEVAESKAIAQKKYLQQLQIACKFRMENALHASLRP